MATHADDIAVVLDDQLRMAHRTHDAIGLLAEAVGHLVAVVSALELTVPPMLPPDVIVAASDDAAIIGAVTLLAETQTAALAALRASLDQLEAGFRDLSGSVKSQGKSVTRMGGGGNVELRVGGAVVSTENPLPIVDSDIDGVWAYEAGTEGTVNVPAGGKVLTISAVDTSGGGTVTINGGSSIPVPESTGFTENPEGRLVAPEIVFTGTSGFFVSWLV